MVVVVISAMREPVTIARAAELTGETPKTLRRLVERGKVVPKACLVADPRHPLLFDLWEIEAALDARNVRRVAAARNRCGVGS